MSSTAKVMTVLYRNNNPVPASIPNDNKFLGRMVALDVKIARDTSFIAQDPVHPKLVQRIESSLRYAPPKTYQTVMRDFSVTTNESKEQLAIRQKLRNDYHELGEDIHGRQDQLWQLVENNASASQINLIIDHFGRRNDDLSNDTYRLAQNEHKTEFKLQRSYQEIFSAASSIDRRSLLTPLELRHMESTDATRFNR